jgi:hypothetical protein
VKLFVATLALALPLCAAENTKVIPAVDKTGTVSLNVVTNKEWYSPGISFDAFGSARTFDLNNARAGAGLGANFFFANNLGVGVEALTENTAHRFIDYAQGNILWRLVSSRAALNLSAGAGYDTEHKEIYASMGGGPEYAITEYLHGFFDARAVKPIEGGDISGLFRLGLRLQF